MTATATAAPNAAPAAVEAVIDGERTFDEIRELLRDALAARVRAATGASYVWVYVNDLTTTQVVYAAGGDDLFQCSYSIAADGAVSLGSPIAVVRTYAPAGDTSGEPPESGDLFVDELLESADAGTRVRVSGRVIEAKGKDEAGGRVFRVRIIRYGESRNGRLYPEALMRESVHLYEGAKAFDHHRTAEELRTSTVTGLVGSYRGCEALEDGIYGDLHLLPSATHTGEALDASIKAQDDGLSPLAGISHDVMAQFKSVTVGGRRLSEAVSIVDVQSADVVANPAAGGRAVRAVAGGITSEESDVPLTKADVLAAFREASDDELAEVLGRVKPPTKTTESAPPAQRAVEGGDTKDAERDTAAAAQPKTSWFVKAMVEKKAADAGLALAAEALLEALPERVSEADVDAQIALIKKSLGIAERAQLIPTVTATVTQEAHDKKVAALDAFFAGDFVKGYHSFKQAYVDFTGRAPRVFDASFNKQMMQESVGGYQGYDSDGRIIDAERSSESMTSATWNLVLGDSITRRTVAEYRQPSLQTWRRVVSSMPPALDFRTQRIDRIGGYGTLPIVAQGGAYQPLTSPTNEEASWALNKRGGTEDLTLEMIANDDVRAISKIPVKLGLAAAQTLFRFVWDVYNPGGANAATTYDSVALYHASHGNTASTALNQSNLSAARLAMRTQAAYGDASNILSLVPQLLVVVKNLEEIAFQVCTSAVAIPATAAGPSDTPNIHQNLDFVVVDYWSSTTGWVVFADPAFCPTFELGFYNGREDPELFTQADPSVGSMFNADVVTYKIRHIYGGTVLEHRGTYRGNS